MIIDKTEGEKPGPGMYNYSSPSKVQAYSFGKEVQPPIGTLSPGPGAYDAN